MSEQVLITAEIISAIHLLIVFFSTKIKKNIKSKRQKFLTLAMNVLIIGCLSDAFSYILSTKHFPDYILNILVFLAFTCGILSLSLFTYYCYLYINEKTKTKKLLFLIPLTLNVVAFLIVFVTTITGKIVLVDNGTKMITSQLPVINYYILLFIIVYLSIITFSKYKEIDKYVVLSLVFFSVISFLTTLLIMLFDCLDFSLVAGVFVCIIVYVQLENQYGFEKIKKLNQDLQNRFEIIQSMSNIYFASYYINLVNDSYEELSSQPNIRKVIRKKGKTQSALYHACEKLIVPEHSEIMKDFFNLSTINERLKDKNVVSQRYIGVTSGWSIAYLIAGDRDKKGNLLHLFYACRKIHDEINRENEQNRKLEECYNIISNAGFGIWHIYLKEGESPRMQVNDKMSELLEAKNKNLSEQEMYFRWYNNILPEAIPSVEASVQEMLSGKLSENTYKWNHPTKGVIYVRCGGTATKLSDGTNVLSGYHADVTDIIKKEIAIQTALEKATAEAESANEAKTKFLFNMSHDIRTPMNAIIGYTELLEKNYADAEKCHDYIKKIQSSSDFLLSLINNVLEMARIESGTIALQETVFPTGMVQDEISSVYMEVFNKKNISFTNKTDVKTKYIYGDVVKLKEIYLNIVSNAHKYTPNGGSISIETVEIPYDKPGYCHIRSTIKDSGIGMSEEYLPHIFEDFSRERTVTEGKVKGTGLGMAIVKRLIDLMGGTISVESEMGKGSVFTLDFYHRVGEEPKSAYEHDQSINKGIFKGKRILLAEDNDLNAEIAIEILKEFGMEVEWAVDGVVCVDMYHKAAAGYYDLILMDVQMPNMDGYKATRIIRAIQDPKKNSIPIIAMTANAFEEDKNNALSAGLNGHVAKPIEVSVLIQCIEENLTRNLSTN